MNRIMRPVLALVLAYAVAFAAFAAQEGLVSTQTRVKRVALFKNGLGFFVREGTLGANRQTILLGPFAAPSHGTFWVSAPASAGLKNVIARQTVMKGDIIVAKDISDLLRANLGKKVTLDGITGTIIGFAPDRPQPITPLSQYSMGPSPEQAGVIRPWGRGEYVLIRTEIGVLAINPYTNRVQFLSDDIAQKYQTDVPGAELEASFASPKSGDWVSVSYLAKGITWAPSYLVDISDGKQATLSAKALIVNEAETLKDTHVDLITGFPNLKFSDVLSPMAAKTNLAAFLQQLGGTSARPEAMVNVMTQAVMYRSGGRGGGGMGGGGGGLEGPAGPMPSYGTAAAGEAAEDLFLYPIENVTLAQGETGYYPLFTESVPFTEFYQWEIPDYVNAAEYYAQPQPAPEQREIVWHSIRLTNTTKAPWTTAPAEMVKNGNIIGQDVLNYTPANAKATVKITQASSVSAEQTETETNRERDAVVLYGDHFDRVTIEGELRVTNYQDKAISLEIKKTVSGDTKETKPQAKDTTLARGLKRMNPVHELTWTIALKPQESQKVSYTYEALIRR
jgi:hypothetical protein